MVEQQVPFAVEDVVYGGGDDLVVVASVPSVAVLPNEGGVVASLDRPDVVYHSEKGVGVAPEGPATTLIARVVALVRDERGHV